MPATSPSIDDLARSATDRFTGPEREILDPARGIALGTVPDATDAEVDRAVACARAAFDGGAWARMEPWERGGVLLEAARRVQEIAGELAQLDSLNVGKPIAQAHGDAGGAVAYLDQAGRIVSTLAEEVIENTDRQLTLVLRQPLGVVATIIPWNYPAALAAASIAGPLAAGNSVVLKPSPETPLSALRIAEVLGELLPDGVLQLVTGGADVGRRLTGHPGVDRVAFTGSTRAGAEIVATGASSFKRLGLELGGKSPTIVLDDAPFEPAVRSALARILANQGENCAAGSRLLVHERIAESFLAALADAAGQARIGDPQDEATEVGPMITAAHRDRVLAYVETARGEGELIAEGPLPDADELREGFFVPVSLWRVPRTAAIWREEVFGPVLAVTTFSSDEEAIELANDTPYGLMAHVWAGDGGRALRVARRVRAGVVRVNRGFEPAFGPWGGFKHSGIGRNFGRWGIEANSELQQICLDIAP